MCGIAGILNLKSPTPLNEPIRKMTDALAHRGPDAEGFYVEENTIALGHRRLSIIDLSTGANQPFRDETGRFTLIFNGEIYNFLDIKALIPEYNFKTSSDTEVILAAYMKWGAACLKQINGMFAFAIWDKKEQSLFIARDRLGIKPLYYYIDNQRFIFSSEIRSLLISGFISKQIDKNALRNYLVFQSVYAPQTIIKDILQLMPGEYAFVTSKGFEKTFYWQAETSPNGFEIPTKEVAQKKVRELLTASVERRMVSDVPLGAFLSGGIDSSAVVALMAQASARPIDTFTVSFAEAQYDESRFADIIAKKYQTHHTTIRLTPDDFLKELPAALDAMDAPSGDGLNTYIVAKATKNAGITVALSGLGGDELFAGYSYFRHFQKIATAYPLYWGIPRGIRNPFLAIANKALSSKPKAQRMIDILKAQEPSIEAVYPHLRRINTEGEVNALLTDGQDTLLTIEKLLKERHSAIAKLPPLSHFTIGELLGYTLNVLLKDTDQFSMATALEVREPFFDYKLVEYVLKVPDVFKMDNTSPKSLLVGALQDLLPNEIVHRPKMGFLFPWKHWLLHELRSFCQEHIDYLAQFDEFNEYALQDEWTEFQKSNGANSSYVKIWQLVVLSYWLKKNEIDTNDF
jgi:asparagine synthase (glutamine-hydrolysing)